MAHPAERAVLVHVRFPFQEGGWEEFESLALSAGVDPVARIEGSRRRPDPRFLVGSGKVEAIREAVELHGAQVVLFDHELTPSQERNLERALRCRVLDRTGLILDIFARRARTFEGKLQVELAQLQHLSTRLVRGWTHLERQRGGIGLRGPGETQLETDRRLIGGRIKHIRKRLEKVRASRAQGRKARQKAALPTVSLVGYTNAGKSTLFNRLTDAGIPARDRLFDTLDPTLRRLELDKAFSVVLADTVGFIRHLPHELVAAFHATLEETREAALLLHVIDAGHPEREVCRDQVNGVLEAIGAQAPQIEVFNKIDALGQAPRLVRDGEGHVRQVWLSAARGEGIELLRQAIREHFSRTWVHRSIHLPPEAGKLRARLFSLGVVREEHDAEGGGWHLEVEAAPSVIDHLECE